MPFVDFVTWVLFSGLLVWAALSDGRTLTIPNRLCLAVALLYLSRLPIVGLADWATGFAIGLLALVIGFIAFERGWIGGGDAKLLAAVLPWAGAAQTGELLAVMALVGGALAILLLIRHRGPFLINLAVGRDLLPLPTGSLPGGELPPMPYGIAIAAGGLWIAVPAALGL